MNEQQVRVFVRQIVEVLRTGASLTAITIDDQIAEMVLKAVDNDLLWSWIYKLIGGFLNDDGPLVVAASEEFPVEAVEAGVDPLTIIAIIETLVALWKKFRK